MLLKGLRGKEMACKSGTLVRIKDLVTGLFSLSLCLIPGISFSQRSNIYHALNSYKEVKLIFIISLHKFSEYYYKTVFFPSSKCYQSYPSAKWAYLIPLMKKFAFIGDGILKISRTHEAQSELSTWGRIHGNSGFSAIVPGG